MEKLCDKSTVSAQFDSSCNHCLHGHKFTAGDKFSCLIAAEVAFDPAVDISNHPQEMWDAGEAVDPQSSKNISKELKKGENGSSLTTSSDSPCKGDDNSHSSITQPEEPRGGSIKFSTGIVKLASRRIKAGRGRKANVISRWKSGGERLIDKRLPTLRPAKHKQKPVQRKPLLHLYLTHLIDAECKQKVEDICKTCHDDPKRTEKTEKDVECFKMSAEFWKSQVDRYFSRLCRFVTDAPKVPKYLCDKITGEIFQNPVITPDGVTYEKKAIQNHLTENGPFDPTTKSRLSLRQLTPNISVRKAVQYFIQEHEWAIDFPTSHFSSGD